LSTTRRHFINGLAAFFGLSFVQKVARAEDAPADLIVTGATIHSVDDAYPSPQAFAVREGRFVFVGSAADAMRLRGTRTIVLDLTGKTVLPGLIDAHLHLVSIGMALHEVDLFGVGSQADLVARTVAFAKRSPDPWIRGDGWDQNHWPDKAFPTHQALSAAIPNRAVALERVDGHAVFANAKAMELAGVTRATPDPAGGRIVRDANGDPTGVLVDNAVALIARVIPPPTHEQLRRAALAAAAECHRWGVTGVGEAATSADDLAVFRELAGEGALDLRNYTRLVDDPQLLAAAFAAGPLSAEHDGRLWVRGVKLFADGALGSHGAALLAPYSNDPSNSGLMRTTQAHIADVSQQALQAGFQMSAHAIGDRANRVVLDAYQAALTSAPTSDHRFRIEHAQVLSPQDIPRFAQLKLIASMQTTHQLSDWPWAPTLLGPERIKGAYAWRSMLDTGVIIANGTDAPVEPVNTLRTFYAAVARDPSQRMTPDEALKSMTIWAAHANFQEEYIGSITPGKYADFVVIDRDWLTVSPNGILDTKILATYFNGSEVFDASKLESTARLGLRPSQRKSPCCA
ncbi:MAG: amidohydrolase, partial [Candidatus Aquilonibacter sp.]